MEELSAVMWERDQLAALEEVAAARGWSPDNKKFKQRLKWIESATMKLSRAQLKQLQMGRGALLGGAAGPGVREDATAAEKAVNRRPKPFGWQVATDRRNNPLGREACDSWLAAAEKLLPPPATDFGKFVADRDSASGHNFHRYISFHNEDKEQYKRVRIVKYEGDFAAPQYARTHNPDLSHMCGALAHR